MAGIQQIAGRAVALERRDVDTDQIIPAAWLKRVERTGFAPGLFGAWRNDPDFVLNRPGAAQAKVLVAGANFGCGSSREHAVWALQDFGFQAVVSPRFADIFRGNSLKGGLLTVLIDEGAVEALWQAIEADPTIEVTVDLVGREVRYEAVVLPFEIDDYTRWRLMEGLDDIDLTLRHADDVDAFESSRPAWKPRTLPASV